MIVEIEIADRPDICIDCSEGVAVEILCSAQPHGSVLPVGKIFATHAD
jgi:hypothetical protein